MAVKLGEMLLKAGLIHARTGFKRPSRPEEERGQARLQPRQARYVKRTRSPAPLRAVRRPLIQPRRHFEIDESVINLIPSEVSQKYLVLR